MKSDRSIQGIYAIVDSQWKAALSLPILAQTFLRGGISLLQLRMKGSAFSEVFPVAREIAALKKKYDFLFFINDFPEVACEVGADGVHVGKEDIAVSEIRTTYGKNLLIGYSSHALHEAVAAAQAGADYIAFGAIFPTRTKGPGHPVQGVEKLCQVVREVTLPVVAIGGIDRTNIDAVKASGASAAAMITSLVHASDIAGECAWFRNQWHNPLS